MNQATRPTRAAAWLLILILLLTCLPAAALAQSAPTVVSPEVAADGVVTFRYVGDATVTRVQVMGEWSKDPTGVYFCALPAWPTPDMTQDANGVWTYSIKLEPNYYNYRFYVWHGDTRANVADPLNPPASTARSSSPAPASSGSARRTCPTASCKSCGTTRPPRRPSAA